MWTQVKMVPQSSSESVPNKTRVKLGSPILKAMKIQMSANQVYIRIFSGGRLLFPIYLETTGGAELTTGLAGRDQTWFLPTGTTLMEFDDLWQRLDYPYAIEIHSFSLNGTTGVSFWFQTTKEQQDRVSVMVEPDGREGNQ